jgi:hypothetical protein
MHLCNTYNAYIHTFENIYTSLKYNKSHIFATIQDDMVACVALGDERNGTCALPKTSLELYNSYVISTNNWIEAVATDWYVHTYIH